MTDDRPSMKDKLKREARRLYEVFREASVADTRSLALMRMVLGILILVDLWNRIPDLRLHYSDAGFLPRAPGDAIRIFFAYHLSGSVTWMGVLFAVEAVAAIALILGFRTRFMTFVVWWLHGSLHARNGLVLQGGDALFRMILFWTLFVPLGARFSLDARRAKSPPPTAVVGGGTFALGMQLALLYFVTGTLKARLPHWQSGEAVYNALSADEFVTWFGLVIYPHFTLLRLLTWGTLLLEIVGPFLLLISPKYWRFRAFLVISFILFHLGLASTLRLGLFSYVAIAGWTYALPTGLWEWLAAKAARRPVAIDEAAASLVQNPAPAASRFWTRFAAALSIYLVLSTMVGDLFRKTTFARVFLTVGDWLDFKEEWSMFVPARKSSGHYLLVGNTVTGRELDVLVPGREVAWTRPEVPSRLYPNQRWRKLFMNMRKKDNRGHAEDIARAMCRAWNESHGPDERLLRVRMVLVKHTVGPRYDHGPSEVEELAAVQCPVTPPPG